MKTYLILTALLSLIMMVFPIVPLIYNNSQTQTAVQAMAQQTENTSVSQADSNENTIRVLRASSGKIIDVEMFDYVCGVLAAEMPITYHEQALKAQAVACYTYALWIKENSDNAPNELCDVSDDTSSYQGFLDKEQMKEKWGEKYDENYNFIKQIVNSVMGQYISFNNKPIMAVYHSLSSGITVSAKDAWGENVSYLQSVSAPGDKLSPDFCSVNVFTSEQLKTAVSKNNNIAFDFSKKAIGNIEKNSNSYIKSIEIYSQCVDAKTLRSILNLNSPYFTAETAENKITFKVYGKGHSVGMSQYSADYMARQGSDYKEILTHFYKAVTVELK